MEYALATRLISDLFLKHKTERIDLHILGEPLLHPRLFDILEYIRDKKRYPVVLSLGTNGILLGENRIHKQLLDSGVDVISINVRSDCQDEYMLKGRGEGIPSYEEYMEIIKQFITEVHMKRQDMLVSLGYFHTVYSPYALAYPNKFIRNRNQIARLVSFWHDVVKGCPGVFPREKVRIPSLRASYSYENTIRLSKNLELRIERIGLWHNDLLPREYRVEESLHGDCGMYQNLVVTFKGDVVGCCLDYAGEITFGNITNNSIEKIALSRKYQDFAAGMKQRTLLFPLCRKCMGVVRDKASGEKAKLMPSRLKFYYFLITEDPATFFIRGKRKIFKLVARV